jgi:membrane-associated phospholipid phosphatase
LSQDLQTAGTDAAAYVTAPAGWQGRDWVLLGAAVGMVGATAALDDRIRDASRDYRTPTLGHLSAVVRGGEPLGWGGAAVAATYLGGLAAGNVGLRETGLEMAEAAVFSGAVAGGLKVTAGRSRPREEEGARAFHPFRGGIGGGRSSFPSEHATFAFAVASVASERVPGLGWAAYPLASLVALSRLYDDKHWASDAAAGAVLGTATGLWVAHRKPSAAPAVSIVPCAPDGGLGLSLAGSF